MLGVSGRHACVQGRAAIGTAIARSYRRLCLTIPSASLCPAQFVFKAKQEEYQEEGIRWEVRRLHRHGALAAGGWFAHHRNSCCLAYQTPPPYHHFSTSTLSSRTTRTCWT